MNFAVNETGEVNGLAQKHGLSAQVLLTVFFAVALIIGFGYLTLNIYGINKGLSLWDESYYLLSYEMAKEGFFRHFNNTPFVVAFLFEWLRPGIIGYRAIHLVLSLFGAGFLVFSISRYLAFCGYSLRRTQLAFLYALAFVGAMYAYQLSGATLSYNHLNEFIVLVAQGLLFLGVTKIGNVRAACIFFAGFVLALNIYVKPTSFLSITLSLTAFIIVVLAGGAANWKALLAFAAGMVSLIFFSLLVFYPPAQWLSYLTLMADQQAHSPAKVLSSFLSSGFDILMAARWVLLSGLVVVAWFGFSSPQLARQLPKYSVLGATAVLLTVNIYFVYRFLFPAEIWKAFEVHWWYLWVYSSTVLVFSVILNFVLGLCLLAKDGTRKNRALLMVMLVLVSNPVGMAVGTLNGFYQVHIHLTSWLLLCGIVLMICFRLHGGVAFKYSSLLTFLCIVVGVAYTYRQQLPLNVSGQGAVNEQVHRLSGFPKLEGIAVDDATYELLSRSKSILDKYPDLPTVSFFDLPGMQYALGRKWVVLDPWLTNFDTPPTKDDVYNCQVITGNSKKLQGTIFIVSNEKAISPELRSCLKRVGFPDRMKLIGTVSTKIGFMDEPVRFYLNP